MIKGTLQLRHRRVDKQTNKSASDAEEVHAASSPNLDTDLFDDAHGFHTTFVGGLAVDDTDDKLAGVAILRVQSTVLH